MSSSEEKSFATTAAGAAAFPLLAGHLVAGFSELALLNLSMYASVLAGAQNKRESMPPSQTPEPLAWNRAGTMLPFAAQVAAHTSAVMDMTLQTSTAVNRLALDGYVETVRHATAAIAAMVRSLRVADAMMKSPGPAPDDSGCAIATMPPAALRDIARTDTDSVAGVAPTGRRQRSQSR
ncbi:hypothetical protein [Paraburkholderia oxyphila]|uniref:hypothetical protein n=1 Tax=Paraburkholderia oxyphila TaxID=614212 RepID=UPI000484667B|nr:hypothetical protein [Paraburkholderia oxyphila]